MLYLKTTFTGVPTTDQLNLGPIEIPRQTNTSGFAAPGKPGHRHEAFIPRCLKVICGQALRVVSDQRSTRCRKKCSRPDHKALFLDGRNMGTRIFHREGRIFEQLGNALSAQFQQARFGMT